MRAPRFAILLPAFLLTAHAAAAVELRELPRNVRTCDDRDLRGLHKLREVYEKNEAAATRAFHNAPHQYLFFRPNQTFADVEGSVSYPDAKMMDAVLRKAFKEDVRQFVLGENGALYFYKDGQATHAFACQYIHKNEPPFREGDLLFTATDPATKASVIRVYSRQRFNAPAPQAKKGAKASARKAAAGGAKVEKRKKSVSKKIVKMKKARGQIVSPSKKKNRNKK